MPRLRPPRDPVTLHFDGETVVAERGEPAAVALLAAGHSVLARSPKFHRPRGPACLRAACDGCLARVDGEPNVMTCRVPAAEGTRIETQNVVGSRDTDLLRMADWFFPEGMNHHELFAGVPGVQRVMQAFARRVAGLGKLPQEVALGARGVAADGGRAGRRRGRRRDDGRGGARPAGTQGRGRGRRPAWGGSLRALPGGARVGAGPRSVRGCPDVRAASPFACGRLRRRSTDEDVLVAGLEGIEVVSARTLVLAPGPTTGRSPSRATTCRG